MAIAGIETSRAPIQDLHFKAAGFLSFFNTVLSLPLIIFGLNDDLKMKAGLLFFIQLPLAVISIFITIYVILQLKRLLNERYDIRNMNSILTALILCNILFWGKSVIMAFMVLMFPDPDIILPLDGILGIFIIMMAAIVGLILGVSLLRITDESSGLLWTYAKLSKSGSICILTVILIPIGMVIGLINNIVLGILLLQEAETEPQIEFV